MVSHLLQTQDVERELAELILEKTEGVPFFIEEFIKSLKDLKIIEKKGNICRLTKGVRKVTIPSTIQDLIMARVDSLPEGAKEILQTGSVIEREFSYDLIKQVINLPEQELLSHLSILKDSELLYERGIYPESTYIFKHALTHELVYDSILMKRKKKLHGEIGKNIEELYSENIREYCGVLADHFIEGEHFEKGAEYSRLASSKARKAASFDEAISYNKKRIASLERLPRQEDVEKQIIDARVTLGLYYLQMTILANAKEAVEPIIDLALKCDYKRRISQIYAILGTHSFVIEEDYTNAFQYLNTAVELAKELKDFASLWAAHHWIGHAYSENCEFERALYHIEKSLEIAEMAKVLWSIAIMKSCIAMNVYNAQGKIDLGYRFSREGIEMAEESGDAFSKADSYPQHGATCYFKGFLDEAEKYLLRGSAFCKKTNYTIMEFLVNFYLGELSFDIRDYQKSQDYLKKGILILEHAGTWPSFLNGSKIAFARAKVMNNEKDIDLESLYKFEDKNKMKLMEGFMAKAIGEILLNIDDQHMIEAEDWIKKAIKADHKNGKMWHLGRNYALYSEMFKRKGDQPKAKENLSKAIDVLKDCGADGWVDKYEKELAML
jgi:tetratricopeptide (TPR) repeat protein